MSEKVQVERFETANGALIFRLPLEVFPQYLGYAHLVVADDHYTLIDVGSGFGSSHQDLLDGLQTVRDEHNLSVSLKTLDRVLISHGHIDHFGGLNNVHEAAPNARIACHPLAKPVLMSYDERITVTRKNVSAYFHQAGLPADRRESLMNMYMMGKQSYKSVPVDETVRDGDMIDDVMQITHVPGHSPGLIMIQIDNILITTDHILPETSVALSPERLAPYAGVGHYIRSLELAQEVKGVDVALGGHEWPMMDYYAVARRTLRGTIAKVERVLEHCVEPKTIYQIAHEIYGESMAGYGELLRLWQTGARVEYLNLRGQIRIANLEALETEEHPVFCYQRV